MTLLVISCKHTIVWYTFMTTSELEEKLSKWKKRGQWTKDDCVYRNNFDNQ